MVSVIKFFSNVLSVFLVYLFNILRINNRLKLKQELFNLKVQNNVRILILGTVDSIQDTSLKESKEIERATTEYKYTHIIIKANYGLSNNDLKISIDSLKMILSDLKKNLKFYMDLFIYVLIYKGLNIVLRLINYIKIFDFKSRKFTSHLIASIGLTEFWGIKNSFKEVIFGGVDLNHDRRFYDKEDLYAKYKIILDSPKTKDKHKTNDADFSEITIVEALNSLKTEIGSRVSFSVLSNNSVHRKIMPYKQF